MQEFERFRLIVRHSAKYGPIWAIRAEMLAEPIPATRTAHMTYDEQHALRIPMARISFYVYVREFEPLFERAPWPTHVADGFRKAEICGDSWCFYDWEVTTRTCGRKEVDYRTVRIPRQVVHVFNRYAKLKARTLPYDTDHEIDIPFSTREAWCKNYGHGTGQVRFEVDDCVLPLYKEHFGSPDFMQRLTQLENMARGTTRTKWQEAVVKLRHDFAGFIFTILTPEGATSLWGGLIYHQPGKEAYAVELNAPKGAHWSIHT